MCAIVSIENAISLVSDIQDHFFKLAYSQLSIFLHFHLLGYILAPNTTTCAGVDGQSWGYAYANQVVQRKFG